jgi:hypothetical protein
MKYEIMTAVPMGDQMPWVHTHVLEGESIGINVGEVFVSVNVGEPPNCVTHRFATKYVVSILPVEEDPISDMDRDDVAVGLSD